MENILNILIAVYSLMKISLNIPLAKGFPFPNI